MDNVDDYYNTDYPYDEYNKSEFIHINYLVVVIIDIIYFYKYYMITVLSLPIKINGC